MINLFHNSVVATKSDQSSPVRAGLRGFQWDRLSERHPPVLRSSPDHRVGRCLVRKRTAEVRKKHESLRADPMFPKPLKARHKTGAATADWIQCHGLAGRVCLHFVNLSIEIENVHQRRPLARQDRVISASNSPSYRALTEPEQSTAMATSPIPSQMIPGRYSPAQMWRRFGRIQL
jgi:hypothetical protein